MQIVEIDPLPLDVETAPRSRGLHLSQILYSLANEIGLYGDRGSEPDETAMTRIEAGFIFERALELAAMARRIDILRPGEFVRDGIICSPDGIAPEDWAIEEFKCTWKSSREAPQGKKFWTWWVQIKAYCYVVGATRARLRALFVNGDYTSYVPQLRAWQADFTARELEENWVMIRNHARAKGWL